MREKLYTIPLNDAIRTDDECPFCFLERKLEQDLMDFVLGSQSSYMERDVREKTDQTGFCRSHFSKMYSYGNTLGNAWILKTHYQRTLEEMKRQMEGYRPSKTGFFERHGSPSAKHPVAAWIREREDSCFICNQFRSDFDRYLDTFLVLWQKDGEFRERILNSKGFCLSHFGLLCDYAEIHLKDRQKALFFPPLFNLMQKNMERLYEDVSWLIEKFDYRNRDADWKTSRDAIQRGMQKLKGGYPADPPYKAPK